MLEMVHLILILELRISRDKVMAQIATNKVKKGSLINPDIQRLEISMSEKLGAKLKIDHKNNGNGKIIINYNSLDELEGIIDHIK